MEMLEKKKSDLPITATITSKYFNDKGIVQAYEIQYPDGRYANVYAADLIHAMHDGDLILTNAVLTAENKIRFVNRNKKNG